MATARRSRDGHLVPLFLVERAGGGACSCVGRSGEVAGELFFLSDVEVLLFASRKTSVPLLSAVAAMERTVSWYGRGYSLVLVRFDCLESIASSERGYSLVKGLEPPVEVVGSDFGGWK